MRGTWCLSLCIHLADALDYLHRQQLIHRDMKPSNIIFVKGVPKFADIGLVTDIATKGRDVTYLGTPGRIAPEGPSLPQEQHNRCDETASFGPPFAQRFVIDLFLRRLRRQSNSTLLVAQTTRKSRHRLRGV